jgi:hypothetical protein
VRRVADGLLHLGHPVGEVAVIKRLAIERWDGRQRRYSDRVLVQQERPAMSRFGPVR